MKIIIVALLISYAMALHRTCPISDGIREGKYDYEPDGTMAVCHIIREARVMQTVFTHRPCDYYRRHGDCLGYCPGGCNLPQWECHGVYPGEFGECVIVY